ncbi:MAG: GNAT family protein [Candidatus Limnocylindria bacterium]
MNMDVRTKPTLVGDRVILRPVTADDAPGLLDLVADEEGNRLTGTRPLDLTLEGAQKWYGSRGDEDDRLDLAVVDTATGEYAGEVVLNELDSDSRSCNFRIGLRAAFRERGLGSEATRLIVDHAFAIGLHRVELTVYAINPRARRVYEKAGFVLEGIGRDALLWEDEWTDALVMSILETDRK